ncbi:MAG TPA: uracil-DNA glycosylase [Gemmatimonadales bacterium]|nr:uracil-DNA glycosylase [Gemmatimonadales bacterium]
MADKWQVYLRQQAELGGGEIYPVKDGRTGSRAVVADEGSTPDRLPAGPSAVDWRRGAPPIPGPGFVIERPIADLLGPDLDHLESLDAVAEKVAACTLCALSKGRKHTVPGEGDPNARLMLVGEGPGATEDETGRPFVGAAGELLTQILGSIGISRESVFIANIVKCRPPQNRKPLPDESGACIRYLHRQVQLVRPKVLVALGGTAAECLLGVRQSLGSLRGEVHTFWGIPLVVTYHPAALLRNPNWKKPTWDDVRIARQLLDR